MSCEQGVLIHPPDPNDWQADNRLNVSELHRELQHRALRWLTNRSCGPCYSSVEIYFKGAQADGLAMTRPNEKFNSAVTDRAHWQAMVVLFEAKASRSDFLSTFGPKSGSLLKLNPPGNYRFLVKPQKVEMPLELLPPGWGVLQAYGGGLQVKKRADRFELDCVEDHVDALFSILHYGSWGKRQLTVRCPDCGDGV